ncbi:hypothetical protein JL475_16710 [Streptomyces sp. M2CJ-2]|nr:hypothetical protein [Streptomyces sp. M2CJ-2]MBL3667598.1 hypothetical protein [Streptomyces sp. M2CJ-2]
MRRAAVVGRVGRVRPAPSLRPATSPPSFPSFEFFGLFDPFEVYTS